MLSNILPCWNIQLTCSSYPVRWDSQPTLTHSCVSGAELQIRHEENRRKRGCNGGTRGKEKHHREERERERRDCHTITASPSGRGRRAGANVLFPRGRVSGNLSGSYFMLRGRKMSRRLGETCAYSWLSCRLALWQTYTRISLNPLIFFVPYSCSLTAAHFAHKRTRNNLSSRSPVAKPAPMRGIFLLPRIHPKLGEGSRGFQPGWTLDKLVTWE